MAWNEPGSSKDKDPWGKQSGEQGPPDLDEVVRRMQQKLSGLFGRQGGGSGGGGRAGAVGIGLIAAVVAVIWAASGFYIIDPAERGVVLRFGQYQATTTPGLHWHLPFPIETVEVVDVDRIRTAEVGYRSGRGQNVTTPVASEALMLTRDENIVDIQFAVQYRVKDARNFLFNVKDPIVTLQGSTESAIREVVGKSNMDFVLTEGRAEISQRVGILIQEILDRYATGLLVTSINMQDAQPPEQVQDAFDDAVKAREDEQRLKNEAEAYSNDVLPRARGLAARRLEEANAYKEQVIAEAEGEAARFSLILSEYRRAPEVTRERLYLETLEDVLGRTSKVMVDVDGGNSVMLMPLDRFLQQRANTGQSESTGGSVSDTLRSGDLSLPPVGGQGDMRRDGRGAPIREPLRGTREIR